MEVVLNQVMVVQGVHHLFQELLHIMQVVVVVVQQS
jgi:hypothetical protein